MEHAPGSSDTPNAVSRLPSVSYTHLDVYRRQLSAAGLSHPDADAAATARLHFCLGHVAEEQARADWESFGQPDPNRGPTATEQTFAVGVQLLVDGVKARFSPL